MRQLSFLESRAFRTIAQVAAPGGPRGRLLILRFHRVLAAPDAMNADEPDAETFRAQMKLIGSLFSVMTLSQAASCLATGTLPPRAACITFDDGYENNRSVAAPILAQLGLSATFFVTTGFLNGGRMWNDTVVEAVRRATAELDLSAIGLGRYVPASPAARVRIAGDLLAKLKYLPYEERVRKSDAIAEVVGAELPNNLMMTDRQVRELASMRMEIGAHSVSHPILAGLPEESARREILESKRVLEETTDAPVRSFAFPNGRPGQDYTTVHVRIVREAGYHASVSTAWGSAGSTSDRFQLPRVSPWDRSARRYALRLFMSYFQTAAKAV